MDVTNARESHESEILGIKFVIKKDCQCDEPGYVTSMDISVKALEEAVPIRRQIDNLESRLSSILRGAPARPTTAAKPTTARTQARRYFSPSTRAKLAAAAKARWARLKGGTKPAPTPTKKKGALTPAGRRKLSELMKARWRQEERPEERRQRLQRKKVDSHLPDEKGSRS